MALTYSEQYPVLYVDDEQPNLLVFQSYFSEDFTIICASSASEALDILERRRVSILFADKKMPGMDGIELCELVKKKYPSILRILVTAFSDQQTAIDSINRGGVIRYLLKPWNVEEVEQILRDLVSRAHLETMVRKLQAGIVEKERYICLATTRAHLLHDLANINMLVASCHKTFEDLLGKLKSRLTPGEQELFSSEIATLKTAVNYAMNINRKTRSWTSASTKAQHSVKELLDTVKELVRIDLDGVAAFVVNCPDDVFIWADRVDISRILVNLIQNAGQAIENAGIEEGLIQVEVEKPNDYVSFKISDNGPGIPEKNRERIFDLFFTTKGEGECRGQGLAICRELAVANGGEIVLTEHEKFKGSTFLLNIPAIAHSSHEA